MFGELCIWMWRKRFLVSDVQWSYLLFFFFFFFEWMRVTMSISSFIAHWNIALTGMKGVQVPPPPPRTIKGCSCNESDFLGRWTRTGEWRSGAVIHPKMAKRHARLSLINWWRTHLLSGLAAFYAVVWGCCFFVFLRGWKFGGVTDACSIGAVCCILCFVGPFFLILMVRHFQKAWKLWVSDCIWLVLKPLWPFTKIMRLN